MTPLDFIVEPERLLLTWQPKDEASPDRTRRSVGEVWHDTEGVVHFRYLKDTVDFACAVQAGFDGFPAFDRRQPVTSHGVIETLIRRLPPRNREDFREFLEQHRLSFPFEASDLALLGYTGAKLPADGFSLVPVFPDDAFPCDYLAEVAGLRHVFRGDVSSIRAGDEVELTVDSTNRFEPDAVAVLWKGLKLGYINRALRTMVGRWLADGRVSAVVERVNGRPERPLVYIRLMAR